MTFLDSFKASYHHIKPDNFEEAALTAFDYQWHQNSIYKAYSSSLGKNPANVRALEDIPFLPISFFKHFPIQSGQWVPEKIFQSSGTTQSGRSKHLVRHLSFYLQNTQNCFFHHYGIVEAFDILALLPSYQQQGNSSLIAMVDHFMQKSSGNSSYYLEDSQGLRDVLNTASRRKKLLIGVSFALLDLANSNLEVSEDPIIMETGGMKGRRKEMIREELHQHLRNGFPTSPIHSEYGMTELLSQAYAPTSGQFSFPPWAKTLIRDINDPFSYVKPGSSGGINIIDLANIESCAFVETQDLGRLIDKNRFEVLGRFDNSDIRGCNLLV